MLGSFRVRVPEPLLLRRLSLEAKPQQDYLQRAEQTPRAGILTNRMCLKTSYRGCRVLVFHCENPYLSNVRLAAVPF